MKLLLFLGLICGVMLLANAAAQSSAAGEAEAQKCEERIATVQRDQLGKYDSSLADLQLTLQKATDLEGALAVRSERERLAKEMTLGEKDFVPEPKSLRALQTQTATKLQELLTQLVTETVPKLIELKKQLTLTGKLDDAVLVRSAIEKLQNNYLPIARVEAGAVVRADALIVAFGGDRARADKIYKGQKIVVRGVVGGFRIDPADNKSYHVFLAAPGVAGWIQCAFAAGDNRFREEKAAYNVLLLAITGKDGETSRLQKGSTMDVRGICEGWDEAVRLTKCEIAR